MSDRNFVCDIEPQGNGGWEVWISEEPYRGIDTDSALGEWERKRIGGSWTSRRFVGHRPTRFLAGRAARTAIRRALSRAAECERAGEVWRANRERRPFRMTTADVNLPTATPPTDSSEQGA